MEHTRVREGSANILAALAEARKGGLITMGVLCLA